jgi:2-polyprenyl-3-methyl-5-hydroxy-6-metoxy-1,4-benzoquinol methylase
MKHENLYQDKRTEYYSNSRLEILPFVPATVAQVLDVGCGTGGFGEALKANIECTVWGVEPDEQAALEARTKLDCVFNTTFDEAIDLHQKRFDCIFFNDVLEHLIDPYSALKFSKELLLPNGYVIASIPNILHFFTISKIIETQDWKYEDEGILDKTHLRFFTKKSITRMFEDCGFKLKDIQGIRPTYGNKYNFLNFILCNRMVDMKYIQFVALAQI